MTTRSAGPSDNNTDISRRDFINGAAVGVVGMGALASCAPGGSAPASTPYPPRLTGMRGAHPGSFEAAHQLRDDSLANAPVIHSGEHYDLVIVGAGISGLAAAHFYKQAMQGARILLLDNHDDFGGHAKRNEFRVGAHTLLGAGGTLGIDSPRPYSPVADRLLRDIGIKVEAWQNGQDESFYSSRGLQHAVFFDRSTFGADYLATGVGQRPWREILRRAPLSEAARRDIALIEEGGIDYLPALSSAEKKEKLSRISYLSYLADLAKIDPVALVYFQTRPLGWYCVGIDGITALDAWAMDFPGFAGLKLEAGAIPRMGSTPQGYAETGGSYKLHMPDGNASVARLLVKSLVPKAVPGSGLADTMLTDLDYGALDRANEKVRIRLSSTVIAVRHRGDPERALGVDITYINGGQRHIVQADRVIMASWNMMIPYIVRELPKTQVDALHSLVKMPLAYTNVALKNWRAFEKLNVAKIAAPGSFFTEVELNETVDFGRYKSPRNSSDPIVVRMTHVPCQPGLSEHDQNRAGRAAMLARPFAEFEHNIRDQLSHMLAGGGFDHRNDIAAITVNRWPHGYPPEYNPLWEPLLPESEQPHVLARQRFGRVAIANADSGRSSYTSAAIDQAHRAVGELLTLAG